MHQREDLLLEDYSWVNPAEGKVRIPIERAIELTAQRGLPVATSTVADRPLLAEEHKLVVKVPLTNGFARTGYEQDQMAKDEAAKTKE